MENFKLSITKIDYFVNETKKTVTCVLTYDVKTTYQNIQFLYVASPKTDSLFNFKAVGVAKTNDNDTFDLATGKKVALAKAEINAYKNMMAFLADCRTETLNKFFGAIDAFNKKAIAIIDHNNEYISNF